jgi:uncharacterized protein
MDHAGDSGAVDFAQLFKEIRTIAVVGYSDNPERAGHFVAHYAADQGYIVLAINPRFGDSVNGLRCFKDLAAIPPEISVDLVDVFRSPDYVPPLVDDCGRMQPRPKYFWMQLGAENEQAAERCLELGIVPIMHACLMAAHKIHVR